MEEFEFDIRTHKLVPEHIKLTEEEKQELLKSLNITIDKLPMITKNDPAIRHLEPKVGDIIKIIRNSPTNKKMPFYRVVIHG
jgi:DNA-directed RNA polymerase subunit H (RpoH/RPB5)